MKESIVFALVISNAFASFCGDSAIPYSFEALEDGQPILGCARPTCFGWNTKDDADFNSINGKQDGFFREEKLKSQTFEDGKERTQQSADCEEHFHSTNCNGDDQWVGGVAPLMNVFRYPTLLKCCTYAPLRVSSDRGVATVQQGEFVAGGEVFRDGIQYAFDYISDVTKIINGDGTLTYEVNVKRFPCLPVPTKKISDTYLRKRKEAHTDLLRAKRQVVNHPGQETPEPEETTTTTTTPMPTTTTEEPDYVPDLPEEEDPTPKPPHYHTPRPRPPVIPNNPAPAPTPSAMGCFTGDTMVNVMNSGLKRMDELTTNDWVLSVNETESIYIPVIFWLHRVPKEEKTFIKLELEDGTLLKLTEQHFIFKTECSTDSEVKFSDIASEAVFAEKVIEGDCFYRLVSEKRVVKTKVAKVSRIEETGIYAPMTSNGKIVVNGILASCHNVIQSHTIQTTFFSQAHRLSATLNNIFGNSSESDDLPIGMNLLLEIMNYILPKNLVTM